MKMIPYEERAGYDRRRLAKKIEAERAEVLREIIAYQLAEVRKAKNVTQQEIARALGLTQPSVSKMEASSEQKLSNLRGYTEAIGGRPEIAAVFDDERWVLKGIGEELEEDETELV